MKYTLMRGTDSVDGTICKGQVICGMGFMTMCFTQVTFASYMNQPETQSITGSATGDKILQAGIDLAIAAAKAYSKGKGGKKSIMSGIKSGVSSLFGGGDTTQSAGSTDGQQCIGVNNANILFSSSIVLISGLFLFF